MLISSMQMLNLTIYIVYSSQMEMLQLSQQVFQANQQLLQPSQQVFQANYQLLQPSLQVFQASQQVFQASQQVFQASHLSRQYKQVGQARVPILDQRKEKIKVLLQLLEQPVKEVEFH